MLPQKQAYAVKTSALTPGCVQQMQLALSKQGFCKPVHAPEKRVKHVHTRICEGWVIVKDRDNQQEVCDGREGDARCCSKAPDK